MRFMRIGAFSALSIAVLLTATVGLGCGPQQAVQVSQAPASSTADLMKQRGLTEADVSAALQTYTPTGKKDEYLTFASGGHGGNMIVIGVMLLVTLRKIIYCGNTVILVYRTSTISYKKDDICYALTPRV